MLMHVRLTTAIRRGFELYECLLVINIIINFGFSAHEGLMLLRLFPECRLVSRPSKCCSVPVKNVVNPRCVWPFYFAITDTVGSIFKSVCLSVCPRPNSKTNDSKVFKLRIGCNFCPRVVNELLQHCLLMTLES